MNNYIIGDFFPGKSFKVYSYSYSYILKNIIQIIFNLGIF